MKEIWLVARELGGWAEAGGIKDVVRDQSEAFPKVGWTTHVVLPLYGFLKTRVTSEGELEWAGQSLHPTLPVPMAAWKVRNGNHTLHFLETPGFAEKSSLYTYTAGDEAVDPKKIRGEGFSDGFSMNLEFQWAVASFWYQANIFPPYVLGHDGHTAFLPAIARTHSAFSKRFQGTTFAILIHNAGPGYRQEMGPTPAHDRFLGLSAPERKRSLLDRLYDPFVSAAHHAKLATVSENYADELRTGRNDFWSGPFGRWLRTARVPLEGITNGLSTLDKDPRDPEAAGIPAGFDPLQADWAGKAICRRVLREQLLLKPSALYGRLVRWEGPLYVMQGRLTAQKGVDALTELTFRALRESPEASFLIMAQGERRHEERMIHLARDTIETGRFLFINKFDEPLAKLVFAAGDFFLMPSEYEPCGLTDLKAQLMGTLPIVHRVGGLVKVVDGKTGFSYEKGRAGGFWGAYLRSLYLWKSSPTKMETLRRQAFLSVLENFQWSRILEERYIPWLTDQPRPPILA